MLTTEDQLKACEHTHDLIWQQTGIEIPTHNIHQCLFPITKAFSDFQSAIIVIRKLRRVSNNLGSGTKSNPLRMNRKTRVIG